MPRLLPTVACGGDFRAIPGELTSRIRSAISPWIDRRKQIDVIRDRLEERAFALVRELAPTIQPRS